MNACLSLCPYIGYLLCVIFIHVYNVAITINHWVNNGLVGWLISYSFQFSDWLIECVREEATDMMSSFLHLERAKKKEVITAVGSHLFCWSCTSRKKRELFNWLTCRKKKNGTQLSGGRSLPHLSPPVIVLSPSAHKLWARLPLKEMLWGFFLVRATAVSLSSRLKLCCIDKAKLLFPSSAVSCVFVPPWVDTVGRSTFHRATNHR